jgi:hypothetical protein
MRLASRLCIVGAWITLALGFLLVILFYVLSNPGGVQSGGPGLGILIFSELIIVMLSIFFFLVLYGIGALLSYIAASKSMLEEGVTSARVRNLQEEDGTQLEITPLQKER